ncbi:MAG: carboxypeptidase regulatory-like domain-containing protein, partial [Planctomycetes bacterium]|nr:carboxypeptidase regulatory-like domain-containing protein [Planctomycetota bacterium]
MPLFFALMLAALVAIEGHTIHGGVVGPNGEVVANAEVTARRAGDPGFRGFRTTRGWWAPADPASGAFTIDLDDGGYDLVAHAPSFADSDAIRVEVKDGGDDVILRLRRGATIRGRVVSAIDGSPIGGASVMTRAPRDKGREEIRDETEDPDARRATTGDDGRFEMSGLTPSTFELRVTHPSWVAETSPLLTVWEGQVQAITVALHKPGSIRGIAYSPPGRRAGTLEVAAMRLGTWQFNHTVATNRRGEFEISGIAPGEYQVTLLDEPTRSEFGYEMRNNIDTRTVVVKDGEVVVVELGSHPEASSRPSPDASARRCIVHGIVRDPNGPVRVTAVAVWNRARQFSSEKCVQDRDGRFTTSRLPPGPSELNVWEGDHVTFSEAIDVPIADDFRHDVLLPTGAITGTIVAASTGKPRPQARAHATVADPASAVDVGVPIATESPRWGPTDDAGRFTI